MTSWDRSRNGWRERSTRAARTAVLSEEKPRKPMALVGKQEAHQGIRGLFDLDAARYCLAAYAPAT
eukprot:1395758-Rhodomonas_salina.1